MLHSDLSCSYTQACRVQFTNFPDNGMQAVPENRRKVAVMKGVVIARKNRGWQSAFTIRNYLGNAGGIERTFPV